MSEYESKAQIEELISSKTFHGRDEEKKTLAEVTHILQNWKD